MGSFKNIQVKSANKIIPILKPINRLGHTNPSNTSAMFFVAIIELYDTTTPTEDIIIGLLLAHWLKNCRWDWNQTTTEDIIKNNIPVISVL